MRFIMTKKSSLVYLSKDSAICSKVSLCRWSKGSILDMSSSNAPLTNAKLLPNISDRSRNSDIGGRSRSNSAKQLVSPHFRNINVVSLPRL